MVGCLLLILIPAAAAQDSMENLDTHHLDQQKKMHRLKKGIDDQKTRVKEAREQEISLLDQVEKLDQRLAEERARAAELKKELESQEQRIQQKEEEMNRAQREKDSTSTHVKRRLNAYYRMGPIGVMNVVFSASSLPDLLSFREHFQFMLAHDQESIRLYRDKIQVLLEAGQAYQAERQELVKVIVRVKAQEEMLSRTRQEKFALLQRVKTEKKLYQFALEELEEAAENLTNTLKKIKKKSLNDDRAKITRETAKKKRPKNFGFAGLKGKLSPPVTGTVTQTFGRNSQGKFGITTFAKGIDIKTTAGTEIRAVFDGKVVYAGVLRGYGNLLIIDHGDQYYTLMSRAEKFFKQEGDAVMENEIIGVMTDQEGLLAEGLHFEIRHGTEPENPLHWVNNAELTIKADKVAESH